MIRECDLRRLSSPVIATQQGADTEHLRPEPDHPGPDQLRRHWTFRGVTRRIAVVLVAAMVGSIFGTQLLIILPGYVLSIILGIFALWCAVSSIRNGPMRLSPQKECYAGPAVGLVAGHRIILSVLLLASANLLRYRPGHRLVLTRTRASRRRQSVRHRRGHAPTGRAAPGRGSPGRSGPSSDSRRTGCSRSGPGVARSRPRSQPRGCCASRTGQR